MTLLLCGLGAFFLAQAVKAMFLNPLRPWLKLLVAFVAAAGISALWFQDRTVNLIIYSVAGAGLAVLIHRVARLLSVAGDWCIREIIRNRGR